MKSLALIFKNKKITFWMLSFTMFAMVGLYMYSLEVTVLNVAKRATMQRQISDANNSISDLESNYIALQRNISLDLAYSLGYKDTETTTYIPVKSVSVAKSSLGTE